MYTLSQYLVLLALVTAFGLVLFAAAVVGLLVKAGAQRLAAQAARKLPPLAEHLSPRHLVHLKKTSHGHAGA